MLMVNSAGEGVQVQPPGLSPTLDWIGRSSDDEVLAVFARILSGVGIAQGRAAKILRVGSEEFARLLESPLPEGLEAEPD